MPTITEMPNDGDGSVNRGTEPDSDRQLQPMGHENASSGNAAPQRDIARVTFEAVFKND